MRSSVISLEGMVTLKLHALQWRRFLGRNQILFGFGRSFWDMFVDMEIDNSEIRFTPERCRISKRGPKPSHPSLTRIRWSYCILQEKTQKDIGSKYLQSNSPINMMHAPQIPCPNKNCPTIQSPPRQWLWSLISPTCPSLVVSWPLLWHVAKP